MASASHTFTVGLPAAGNRRHDGVVRRTAQTTPAWRFVSLAVASGPRGEDGCWLKLDGSPDWQRIADDAKLRKLLEPLLEDGNVESGDHPHLAVTTLKSRLWLATKFLCIAALLAGATMAVGYREAVSKYAQDFLAVTPAPQFTSDIEDAMAKAVTGLRQGLPKRIDQMTTLMWVSYSGTTMVFDNRLEVDSTKVDESTKKKLAQLITVNTCGSPASRKLLDLGGAYRYVYSDMNAKVMLSIDVDKARCL